MQPCLPQLSAWPFTATVASVRYYYHQRVLVLFLIVHPSLYQTSLCYRQSQLATCIVGFLITAYGGWADCIVFGYFTC
jgi:hypothetical protein